MIKRVDCIYMALSKSLFVQPKTMDIFLISAQGSSKEYPQYVFSWRNKKFSGNTTYQEP